MSDYLPIEYEGKIDKNSIDITEIENGLVDIFELSNFTTDTNNKYTIDANGFNYDGLFYSYPPNPETEPTNYKKKNGLFIGKINNKKYQLWWQGGVFLYQGCFQDSGSGCGFILIDKKWYMFSGFNKVCHLYDINGEDLYKFYDFEKQKFKLKVSEYKCEDVISLKEIGNDTIDNYTYDSFNKVFICKDGLTPKNTIIRKIIDSLFQKYT